jgi:hypothetical protein
MSETVDGGQAEKDIRKSNFGHHLLMVEDRR